MSHHAVEILPFLLAVSLSVVGVPLVLWAAFRAARFFSELLPWR